MKNRTSLHFNSLVADLHCDTAHQIKRGYDLSKRHDNYHIDIRRLQEGGVNFQAFALFLESSHPKNECFSYIDKLLKIFKIEISNHSDLIEICTTKSEAENIIAQNKIAALPAIENGMAIENSLEKLEHFYNHGIRYMTLTHSSSHEFCSSSSDDKADKFGLTGFGFDVIKKMNDLKMIIDVSHISVKAFNDVLKTTTQPIIASHSNAYALCSHDRNLTDEQLKALADNGGIIGINFCPVFLSNDYKDATEKFVHDNLEMYQNSNELYSAFISEDEYQQSQKKYESYFNEYKKAVKPFEVNYMTVVDHIDYIVNLIGPDHVALGSDYDGILFAPAGLEDCSKMPVITEELLKRNYSQNDIKKILGLNFMRLFDSVCS